MMTKVTIATEDPHSANTRFRAAVRGLETVGRTPGAALDALAEQLDENEGNTLIVVQGMRPDEFFTARQQQRLAELLAQRRTALDDGRQLTPAEEAELEALVAAELDGAAGRAAAMVSELRS
jgi:hypothetical protein